MGLVPSNLGKEIFNKFNIIREESGQYIYIISEPNKQDCPNCISINELSSGAFDCSFVTPVEIFGETISPISFTRGRCPVCYGKGVLEQENKTGINCIVRWNPSGTDSRGDLQNMPAGKEGFNVVQIKAPLCYYEIIRDCIKAEIDNIECELLLPPVRRSVGKQNIIVVSYFTSSGVGISAG